MNIILFIIVLIANVYLFIQGETNELVLLGLAVLGGLILIRKFRKKKCI